VLAAVSEQVGVLNSASKGAELAAWVLEHLRRRESVQIDARQVTRVTPSFANSFVMAVLAEFPNAFASRTCVISANTEIVQAFVASMDRFDRGIRLSSQRIPPNCLENPDAGLFAF
jgi:hypothetical protein